MSQRITIRLSDAQFELLESQADAKGESPGEAVKRVTLEWLAGPEEVEEVEDEAPKAVELPPPPPGVSARILTEYQTKAENTEELRYLYAYGHVRDTAAQRKALAKGRVPERFVSELKIAIKASGIPLSQTAKGWTDPEALAYVKENP